MFELCNDFINLKRSICKKLREFKLYLYTTKYIYESMTNTDILANTIYIYIIYIYLVYLV